MLNARRSDFEEVDQLLLNAELRDALEPFLDDSLALLNVRKLPTEVENDFLASMLAWERAPVLPLSQWFEPELTLPPPDAVTAERLHELLWETIHRMYEKRIVLEFTDHLSDRALYCVLCRDILPSPEKKIELPKNYLHFHCFDADAEPETWLRYYATDHERSDWAAEFDAEPPPCEPPPFPRKMPRRPQ